MTAGTRNLLNEALRYFHNGLFVIPLWDPLQNRPSKSTQWAKREELVALTEHSLSEIQVVDWWTRWPSANIGIVTGPISGVVVIDLDPDKAEEKNRDVSETRKILETSPFCVQTGREGGLHAWFAYDPLLEWFGRSHPTHPTSGPLQIGPGVDLPWYVVAPPSMHPATGKLYAWKKSSLLEFSKHQLPHLPKEFYQFQSLQEKRETGVEKKWIFDMLTTEQITIGNRNKSLASLAGYFIEHHPRDVVIGILKNWNNVNLHVPLSDREIASTVDSIKRTRDRNIWRQDVHWEPPRAEFPTELLFSDNPVVFDYIDCLSKRDDSMDPSMIGPSVFAAASTCMQGRYHIYCVNDWQFPPTFFTQVGCMSTSQKGIPHENILAVLEPSLQYLKDEHGTSKELHMREIRSRNAEQVLKKVEQRLDKEGLSGSNVTDYKDAIDFFRKYQDPFIPFFNLGSPQQLRDRLIAQRQLNIYTEEGRHFYENLVMPSEQSNAHLFIWPYDGKAMSNDLVSKGYKASDGPTALTLHILIQPDVMEEIFVQRMGRKPNALESQGFLPRFMYSMPASSYKTQRCPTKDYKKRFLEARKQLSAIYLEIVRSPLREPVYKGSNPFISKDLIPSLVQKPMIITFTPEALSLLQTFHEDMKQNSEKGYTLFQYRHWTRRAATQAAKIAAFLHHLKSPGTFEPVSAETTQRAVTFIREWAIPHMKIAYQKMSFSEEGRDAHNIWDALVKSNIQQTQTFSYQQVSDVAKNWSRRKPRIQASVEYLYREGFVKPNLTNIDLTHPEQVFECNPYVRF